MRQPIQRTLLGAAIAGAVMVADVATALAQLVQSEVEGESAPAATTQLVTSSTEVRRAVIGLVTVAVVTALLGVWYWLKTGQLARDRHARRYGGKHGSSRSNPRPPRLAPTGPPVATPNQHRVGHRPANQPQAGAEAIHIQRAHGAAQHPVSGRRT